MESTETRAGTGRLARRVSAEVPRESPGLAMSKVGQRARDMLDRALDFLGIRARHYGVLATLDSDGPLSQQTLSQHLRIDRTTMVAVADDLERLGLAERKSLPSDRRTYRLHLTRDGLVALKRARIAVREAEERLLLPLTADERAQLQRLLMRLSTPFDVRN